MCGQRMGMGEGGVKDGEMKGKSRREEGGKRSALYFEPSQPRPSPTPAGLDTPDMPTAVVTTKCCMLHPASSDKTAQPSWLGRRDSTSGFSCFLRDDEVRYSEGRFMRNFSTVCLCSCRRRPASLVLSGRIALCLLKAYP